MKPRIGLTTSPGLHEDRLVELLERAYVGAVVAAGGMPFMLPVLDASNAEDAVSGLDGLILAGGGDVDPAWYSAAPTCELREVDVQRDAWEFALVHAGIARGLPIFGICRGAQVLNVAMGGSLVQHLPDVTELQHCDRERFASPVHGVEFRMGSQLSGIVGRRGLGVNSLHHQAVADVGAGLAVAAWADDGIIEAVEGAGGTPLLGVQWHPELLVNELGHADLFRWLVRQADDRRATTPPQRQTMTGAPLV